MSQLVSESVSQSVSDKHNQWSDSGPIKIIILNTAAEHWRRSNGVDVDNYVDVNLVLLLQQQSNKSGGRPSLWKSVSSPRPIEEEDDR